ncbi:hypothetical protein [Pseudomonas syringae]|uniref:Uncharacterized protein n=1 Tax=Pseudomonas syringae pv. aptata TaxID=83167 RepID=A0A0Q0II02_PSEAP|nr:hypothetical protein [Pseudomonas syringae]KPZ00565.1 hypothetical protein ALO85_200118 [Pseudomonas syringae pv. aptata]MDP5163699.1 hypothetical protein [Pseudomonas syringae pv. aptata str. DSM 50252]RMN70876.1 hypothetical protein ALQ54_200130 [Pseudomonas syringae]RMO71650.1 hypothetical protein ALQ37_200056 [Pseudomonas syringae pv. aptata]
MDKELFRHMFENEVKAKFGDDASFASYDYVHHRNYRDLRVGGRMLGGRPESVSQLYVIVNDLITEEEKKAVFPGAFDLGNFKQLPENLQTYKALEDEIRKESKVEAHDRLKKIKILALPLLGRSFSEFFSEDKTLTLKVLKTLYRFQTEQNKIFTLLAPPRISKKPSYEVRDCYGIEGSTEEVLLISDLKSHASFEMPRERLAFINSTYGKMRGLLDNVDWKLSQEAGVECGGSLQRFTQIVHHLATRIQSVLHVEVQEPVRLPIDEQLYTYLNRMELDHHTEGNLQLLSKVTEHEPPFGEVRDLIAELAKYIKLPLSTPQHLLIEAETCESQFRDSANSFKWFYSKLLDREIDNNTFEKALPLFGKLCKVLNFAEFKKHISMSLALGAMALVLSELHKSTPYQPYWYGKGTISGGLQEYLNAVRFEHWNLDAPEGSHRYWTGRVDYFSYTMLGQGNVFKGRVHLSNTINQSFMKILDTQDLELIDNKLTLFEAIFGSVEQ